MEKSNNSRGECSQNDPSRALRILGRVLHDSKSVNRQLASENAALKEQMANKEISWEKEIQKLLNEIDSLVSTLFMANNHMDDMEKSLDSTSANLKQSDIQRKETERKNEILEEEVRSLKKHLSCQQMETEKIKRSWKAEWDQVMKMKLCVEKSLNQFTAEWESRWLVNQEEGAAELTTLKVHCEEKEMKVKEDEIISTVTREIMAMVEGNLVKLKSVKTELHQSQVELESKNKALKDLLRGEQKNNRELEEKWLQKEHKMEEDLKLLSQLNTELQELADISDDEKAKMRKKEKKARKETEKKLKNERKEEEKRQKKEKKENEKKEKERLKREKTENQEKETQEKKERKEEGKRDKKEKEENEKKEKERLKREKKENEEREKKEKKGKKEKRKIEKTEE